LEHLFPNLGKFVSKAWKTSFAGLEAEVCSRQRTEEAAVGLFDRKGYLANPDKFELAGNL
jgi:hypothetical protein